MKTISFKRCKQKAMSFSNKIILSLFILFPVTGKSQIGLIFGGKFNQAPGWIITDLNNNSKIDLVGKAFYGGIDFELNYGAYRIAFVPELNFSFYRKETTDLGQFSSRMFRFQLNTHIYFLDFKGDCHCPTFSKKGSPLKKGLYLNISPGAGFLINNISSSSFAEKNLYFFANIGVGIGYDIGINKNLTLTTFVNGYYFPSLKWDGLTSLLALPSSGNRRANSLTSLEQIQTGAVLRYHF